MEPDFKAIKTLRQVKSTVNLSYLEQFSDPELAKSAQAFGPLS